MRYDILGPFVRIKYHLNVPSISLFERINDWTERYDILGPFAERDTTYLVHMRTKHTTYLVRLKLEL